MSKSTRRRFLEESMLAAVAACGAPRILRAEEPASRGANEEVRHAVIGLRGRGRDHITELAAVPGVKITYICDPDREVLDRTVKLVEERQGMTPRAVTDLRRVFDDHEVDTVSIATPNHWHALAAIWAMQAGKDAYVEKPVSHNIVEGRRIVDVARATGRLCQTGTQYRSDGNLAAAADYVRAGKLGTITLARSIVYRRRESIGPRGKRQPPAQVDYNLWLGPAADEPLVRERFHYDWHWFWNTGNGELGNNNIHSVDVCRWLTGLSGLGKSVISLGGRFGYEDAAETPNTQLVVHDFGSATIIQETRGLETPPFSPDFDAGWVVHGTEGFLAGSTVFDPAGNKVETLTGEGENHFANFIRAVRNRRQQDLNSDILEGHQSTALCHVGNISYRLGQSAAPAEIRARLGEASPAAGEAFERLARHLHDNSVDVEATPLTLGPLLSIDGEAFAENQAASALLSREYRGEFALT